MNRLFLSKINKQLKKERPILNNEIICTYYYEENYLEISFENGQCSYDMQGTCTMCDYGIATYKEDVSVFIDEMLHIYNSFSEIDTLMLCTNGSFLDDKQLPFEFQREIMIEASKLPCKTIIIESHYTTITDAKLQLIKDIFWAKSIKIELGLETTNIMYQEYILNKKINTSQIEYVIKRIHHYGYTPIINLLIGLPFLNEKEQIDDVLTSIAWCMENETEIVLFPINIKPYTLIYYLYENNLYTPISQWMIIYILSLVEESYLSKIDIAYWGNRDESYIDKKVIFPSCCSQCYPKIHDFYYKYLLTENSKVRKKYINALMENIPCNCFQLFRQELTISPVENIEKRLKKFYIRLEYEFGDNK